MPNSSMKDMKYVLMRQFGGLYANIGYGMLLCVFTRVYAHLHYAISRTEGIEMVVKAALA